MGTDFSGDIEINCMSANVLMIRSDFTTFAKRHLLDRKFVQ
ncbi:hypothetical protein FRUB_02878 [Fimbriiglobus ruber]|uniref:Uncharacterized protein n=1 Tax=Fimbriiglobus ruber TaxID=1908690 RepID=A0A225E1B5_9BACT|nr:hypothetical protein FRUB_02878 [Fimbriiglobus ruber]